MSTKAVELTQNRLEIFCKASHRICSWLEWPGIIAALIVLVITFCDVVSYKLLAHPLLGVIDLAQFGFLVSMSLMGGITLVNNQHLSIDILVVKMPDKVQWVINIIVSILGFLLSIAVIWKGIDYGISLQKTGEFSATTGIPLYPFAFILALGFIPIAFELLLRCFRYGFNFFGAQIWMK